MLSRCGPLRASGSQSKPSSEADTHPKPRLGFVDEIVRVVRFAGWQNSHAGEREVKQALRRTPLKYRLHTHQELFERGARLHQAVLLKPGHAEFRRPLVHPRIRGEGPLALEPPQWHAKPFSRPGSGSLTPD